MGYAPLLSNVKTSGFLRNPSQMMVVLLTFRIGAAILVHSPGAGGGMGRVRDKE